MSVLTRVVLFSLLSPFVTVVGAPAVDANTLKQNGLSAQKLNAQFMSLKTTDPCQGSDMACVSGSFAQCVSGKWQTTECAGGTQCFALPLVNKVGTSLTCDTQADAETRINNTGISGGLTGTGSEGPSFTSVDSNANNCTDSNSVNSSLGASNNASPNAGVYDNRTQTGSDNDNSVVFGSASASGGSAAVTVTVTVTTSSSAFSASQSAFAQSATLAPGFSLPPAPSTTVGVSAASTPSETPTDIGNSTDVGNSTFTISPASASAIVSSLSVANVSMYTSTFGGYDASAVATASVPGGNVSATSGGSSSNGAGVLSFFSTSLASATASASQAPLTAVASPSTGAAASGYGGSGY